MFTRIRKRESGVLKVRGRVKGTLMGLCGTWNQTRYTERWQTKTTSAKCDTCTDEPEINVNERKMRVGSPDGRLTLGWGRPPTVSLRDRQAVRRQGEEGRKIRDVRSSRQSRVERDASLGWSDVRKTLGNHVMFFLMSPCQAPIRKLELLDAAGGWWKVSNRDGMSRAELRAAARPAAPPTPGMDWASSRALRSPNRPPTAAYLQYCDLGHNSHHCYTQI